jgi:hypothetical protein
MDQRLNQETGTGMNKLILANLLQRPADAIGIYYMVTERRPENS